MRHFVDIIKYNVPKITSINELSEILSEGIEFGQELAQQYVDSYYYKDYLKITPTFNRNTGYYYYNDIDEITPSIIIHSALTRGIYPLEKDNTTFEVVKKKNIITSEWINDNFDIYISDYPGYHSMSFQFTDYSVQIFNQNGEFIPLIGNVAFLYKFGSDKIIILFKKNYSLLGTNKPINIIFKPRRISINDTMSSKTTSDFSQDQDIPKIELEHQYNLDEISDVFINDGVQISEIYNSKVQSSGVNAFQTDSNNVVIQRQKAYFQYLNSKYNWLYTKNPTIDSSLPTNYGGEKFKDTTYLDPAYKNQTESANFTDFVKNINNKYGNDFYGYDFYKFNNFTALKDVINNYINLGHSILDFDIFFSRTSDTDPHYKFVLYCDEPLNTIRDGKSFYLYISNVSSKKCTGIYAVTNPSGISYVDDIQFVCTVLSNLNTSLKDEEYFDADNFSIKYFKINNRDYKYLINKDIMYYEAEDKILFEIEYYTQQEENGYSSKVESITSITSENTYTSLDWEIEISYIKKQFLENDKITFKTNIDDIFIPSAMPENLLGDFIIQGFFTHQGQMNGKNLRNNILADSLNLFNANTTESQSILINTFVLLDINEELIIYDESGEARVNVTTGSSIIGEPMLSKDNWLTQSIQILFDNNEIVLSKKYTISDSSTTEISRITTVYFGFDEEYFPYIGHAYLNDSAAITNETISIYTTVDGETIKIYDETYIRPAKRREKNNICQIKNIKISRNGTSIENVLTYPTVNTDIYSQYLRDMSISTDNQMYKYIGYSNKLIEYVPAAFFTDYSKMIDDLLKKKEYKGYDTVAIDDIMFTDGFFYGYRYIDKYYDSASDRLADAQVSNIFNNMLDAEDYEYALILIKLKESVIIPPGMSFSTWISKNLIIRHVYELTFSWLDEHDNMHYEYVSVDFSTLGLISIDDVDFINLNSQYNDYTFAAILLDLQLENGETQYPNLIRYIKEILIPKKYPEAKNIEYDGVWKEYLQFDNLSKYDAVLAIPRIRF